MSDEEDAVVFDGVGFLTSGQFLRIVRRNAIDKDKTTDDQWTAYYAASRMGGTALDWFEDQTEDVQESWKLLRRALLIRWPASAEPGETSSVTTPALPTSEIIPTPAAAAPPPPGLALSKAWRIHPTQPVKGRIRVNDTQGGFLGYLSKNLSEDDDCILTNTVRAAQVVQFTPSHKPIGICVCDDSSKPTGSSLGWTPMQDRRFGTSTHLVGGSDVIKWCTSLDGRLAPFRETAPGMMQFLEFGLPIGEDWHFAITPDSQKLGDYSYKYVLFAFETAD